MSRTEIANKGPKRVRHSDGVEFMLSVITDARSGVTGIMPFAIGGKCPRKGKHYLIPAFAAEDYFSHLTIV